MEFSDVIEKRCSVRSFENRPVPDELLDRIIKDGDMAPSSGNVHGWEFIKVCDSNSIKSLARATYRGNQRESREHQSWIETATAIIVLVYEKMAMYNKYGKRGVEKYLYLDGSACMENMLLSAVDKGLGACYISGFREDEVEFILKLPNNYEIIGFMPVGYHNENEVKNRIKSNRKAKIHQNNFIDAGGDCYER